MDGHTQYRVTVTMEGIDGVVRVGDLVWVPDDAEWAKPLIRAGFLYDDAAEANAADHEPVPIEPEADDDLRAELNEVFAEPVEGTHAPEAPSAGGPG